MSLNHAEIDLVLQELSLNGHIVQNIVQPDFSSIYFELYKAGSIWLYISLKPGFTRMHEDRPPSRSKNKDPRFVELLKSRIKGKRINEICQMGSDRIVLIKLADDTEQLLLYVRLWSNAANIVLTENDGRIIDTFYRRPLRSETSGQLWAPEPRRSASSKVFAVRDWDQTKWPSFGSFLADTYRQIAEEQEKAKKNQSLARVLSQLDSRVDLRIRSIEKKLHDDTTTERFRQLGELLLSNKHLIERGRQWIEVEDWYTGNGKVTIELDPKADPQHNAERYFQKYQKARDGKSYLEEDLRAAKNEARLISELIALLENTDTLEGLQAIEARLLPFIGSDEAKSGYDSVSRPGLVFVSQGMPIFIGRTSSENDTLLRAFVRGNDYWLHVRDRPGGYVFIKVPKGKTVPLEVLLDAATLAVWYSKERGSPETDLFYTQVKYLRRAKHGVLGTVVPTKEKNLHLVMDDARLARLKSLGAVSE